MAHRQDSIYTDSNEYKHLLGLLRYTYDWLADSSSIIDKVPITRLLMRLSDLDSNYAKFNDACAKLMGYLDPIIDKPEYDDLQLKIKSAREIVDELKLKRYEAEPSPRAYSTPQKDLSTYSCDAPRPRSSVLPELSTPRFDGRPDSWISFQDQFDSIVHRRTDLTPTQKLQYLVGSLSDEPRRLIQHLRIEDSNYEIARDLLKNRYHNLRLQTDILIAQLLNLPEIPTRLTGLRSSFLNPLLSAYRALDRLELPVSHWSYLLVHICMNKLPSELKTRFERHYGRDVTKLPTFSQLIEFLEEECRHHETVGNTVVDCPPNKSARSPLPRRAYVVDAPASTPTSWPKCYYCSSPSHYLRQCSQFMAKSPHERSEFVRISFLCYRCLDKHRIESCPKNYKCSSCSRTTHHTLLCFNKSGGSQSGPGHNNYNNRSGSAMGGGAVNISGRSSPRITPRVQNKSPPRRSPPRWSNNTVRYAPDSPSRDHPRPDSPSRDAISARHQRAA